MWETNITIESWNILLFEEIMSENFQRGFIWAEGELVGVDYWWNTCELVVIVWINLESWSLGISWWFLCNTQLNLGYSWVVPVAVSFLYLPLWYVMEPSAFHHTTASRVLARNGMAYHIHPQIRWCPHHPNQKEANLDMGERTKKKKCSRNFKQGRLSQEWRKSVRKVCFWGKELFGIFIYMFFQFLN